MLTFRDNLIIPPSGSTPVTFEEAITLINDLKDAYALQGNYICALLRQAQSIDTEIWKYIDSGSLPTEADMQVWRSYLATEPEDGHLMPTFHDWLKSQ